MHTLTLGFRIYGIDFFSFFTHYLPLREAKDLLYLSRIYKKMPNFICGYFLPLSLFKTEVRGILVRQMDALVAPRLTGFLQAKQAPL